MSPGIKKETYVHADPDTTKALTFDLLDDLREKMSIIIENSNNQVKACEGRFKKLENNKKRNTSIASFFGFLGGMAGIFILWLKEHL
jgi:hypothetical protein